MTPNELNAILAKPAYAARNPMLKPDGFVNLSPLISVLEHPKPRLRQRHTSPTKLHRDFGETLKGNYPGQIIIEEALTLRIANGCRYTPDWWRIVEKPIGGGFELHAYECKGHMEDDAAVKIKVAATTYPWIDFWLVWRNRGEWEQQLIYK